MTSTLDPVAGQTLTAGYLRSWMANWAALSIVKLADTSRASTTTLTADPELQLAVVANTTYTFDAELFYDAGAGQFNMFFAGPAGSTISWVPAGLDPSVTAAASGIIRTGRNGQVVGEAGAGTVVTAFPRGIITVAGTAGTVSVNWAQGTSSATATILKAGSWLRLHPVPV